MFHLLNSTRFSESLKKVEIPKRSGVRAVVVDDSKRILLTLQGSLNPDLSLIFRENSSNKIIF